MAESWLVKSIRWSNIAEQIFQERERQDAKFGEQWEMPLVLHPSLHKDYADNAWYFKQINGDTATDYGHMLLEEVYEALAESDPARMRAELIQVAAVVLKAIEKIDREASE